MLQWLVQHTVIKYRVKQALGPLQLVHSADTRPEDNEFHWEWDKCFDHLHLYCKPGAEKKPLWQVDYAAFVFFTFRPLGQIYVQIKIQMTSFL